jgi:hypothetical protein
MEFGMTFGPVEVIPPGSILRQHSMKNKHIVTGLISLFISIVILMAMFVLPSYAQDKKRVFVLHSYHKGLAWTDSEDAGIQSILKTQDDIEVFTEYMDTKRVADARHYGILAELFR